jgi:hypothetical protein
MYVCMYVCVYLFIYISVADAFPSQDHHQANRISVTINGRMIKVLVRIIIPI